MKSDPFTEFLSAMDNDGEAPPLAEVQITEIKLAAARHAAPVPREGDWVTPVANGAVRGAGRPHLVTAVRPLDTAYDFKAAHGITGRRLTIRVLCWSQSGSYGHFWCEHGDFEPYAGPTGAEIRLRDGSTNARKGEQ